jgi:hypothetical protein
MRLFLKAAAVLLVLWIAFAGVVYQWMSKPPEQFAARMAKLPMAAMMAFPFETMWNHARAGRVESGSPAPDFDLETIDKTARVRLSDYRGKRPVVLVFGSYT